MPGLPKVGAGHINFPAVESQSAPTRKIAKIMPPSSHQAPSRLPSRWFRFALGTRGPAPYVGPFEMHWKGSLWRACRMQTANPGNSQESYWTSEPLAKLRKWALVSPFPPTWQPNRLPQCRRGCQRPPGRQMRLLWCASRRLGGSAKPGRRSPAHCDSRAGQAVARRAQRAGSTQGGQKTAVWRWQGLEKNPTRGPRAGQKLRGRLGGEREGRGGVKVGAKKGRVTYRPSGTSM